MKITTCYAITRIGTVALCAILWLISKDNSCLVMMTFFAGIAFGELYSPFIKSTQSNDERTK